MSEFLIKYREDQLRLPSGVFGAGRWTTEAGASGSQKSDTSRRRYAQDYVPPERALLIQEIRYGNRYFCVYSTSMGKLVGEGSIFGCPKWQYMSGLQQFRLLNDNIRKPRP